MATASKTEDPRQAGPQSPMSEQQQAHPGSDEALEPRADHGEKTYRGTGRLTGRAALITGADSGIGRAVALAFAREGADVLIAYLNEDDDARETERLVRDAGRTAIRVPGDIRDEKHCQELVRRAVDELGRLDLLVNNAAYQMAHEKLEEFSSEQFDRTLKTNLYAMFYLCRAAVPHMQPGAAIINTASIQSFDPAPYLLDYATTKAGIVGFSKALAKLVMQQGIRVNVVAPGPVWTPLIPATMPPDKVKNFGKGTVFGRPAQPAELAPVYVFLASQEASYVTGEVYGVTGGTMPI